MLYILFLDPGEAPVLPEGRTNSIDHQYHSWTLNMASQNNEGVYVSSFAKDILEYKLEYSTGTDRTGKVTRFHMELLNCNLAMKALMYIHREAKNLSS